MPWKSVQGGSKFTLSMTTRMHVGWSKMLNARIIMDALAEAGCGPYTGTPCSLLQPLISYAIHRESSDFIMAANEGEAVAIAAGAWLAGRKPVVMFQNSGFGNAVSPLAS